MKHNTQSWTDKKKISLPLPSKRPLLSWGFLIFDSQADRFYPPIKKETVRAGPKKGKNKATDCSLLYFIFLLLLSRCANMLY